MKTSRDTEVQDHDPKDGDFMLDIKVEDNGNREQTLTIHLQEEKLIFVVSDEHDEEMYGISFPYDQFMDFIEAADFQKAMLAHSKELHEAMGRHPARMQPLLKLIDGGGNK